MNERNISNAILRADLHMHSEYSPDGELKTGELLNECKQHDLSIISITDHNVVGGIAGAVKDAVGAGIKVIPGIEIDCIYKGTDLHVLGYNINWKSNDFIRLEKDVAARIMAAFTSMTYNLSNVGIDVDPSAVLSLSGGRLPTAELIAEYLLGSAQYENLEKLDPYRIGGNRSDMPYLNFYLDFFAQGKPAYVRIDFMDFAEAIEMIVQNGGTPIVAHPGHNLKGREETVIELLDQGAHGLEVFNNYHTAGQIDFFADVALKRNVLMTCGSDFHGKNKPTIRVGQYKLHERYKGYLIQSVEELLC